MLGPVTLGFMGFLIFLILFIPTEKHNFYTNCHYFNIISFLYLVKIIPFCLFLRYFADILLVFCKFFFPFIVSKTSFDDDNTS